MVKLDFTIKGTKDGLKKELSKRLVDEPTALTYALDTVERSMTEKLPVASVEVRVCFLTNGQGRIVNNVQVLIEPLELVS